MNGEDRARFNTEGSGQVDWRDDTPVGDDWRPVIAGICLLGSVACFSIAWAVGLV